MFEYALAKHCAPTLAGLKPANLLSVANTDLDAMPQSLYKIEQRLWRKQIRFYRLCSLKKRELFLVYRQDLLESQLRRPEHGHFLQAYGYQPTMSLPTMLALLAQRLQNREDYPHEIGIFLGYPMSDVQAFIKHRGQHFRLCGYWKVYSNVQSAKQLFSAYDQVREFFCAQVLDGKQIESITYGGTQTCSKFMLSTGQELVIPR